LEGIRELNHFLKDKALILIGSDGREERHPQSETEMIILTEEPIDVVTQTNIFAAINDLNQEIDEIEIKLLDSSVLSFYNNQADSVYPDRVLNGFFLLGDESLFYKAKLQVLQEMNRDDEVGRKIRETMKSQLKSYRRAIREGKYRGHQIFMIDGDQGYQYYFEGEDWRENIMGFKMGPLRAVQRKLDLLIVSGLKAEIFTVQDLFSLPSNTVDRIAFFTQKGLFNGREGENFALAYIWFLREYHKAQETFKQSDRTRVITASFSFQEFEQNIDYIKEFLAIKNL
jgi:hypothetical protein